MTREQFTTKYQEVVASIARDLTKDGETLLASGAIDLESWEDNYLLPKAVAIAAMKSGADKISMPRDEHGKLPSKLSREIANFQHFI